MDRYRYKLDGWDALIVVVGLVIGIGGGIALGFSGGWAGARAVSIGIAGLGLRRLLSPRKAELYYETRPQSVTWRLVPMILIGVGSLITLIAILAYLVIRSAVIQDAIPARYLALPFVILFVGVAMIVKGARRLRRS